MGKTRKNTVRMPTKKDGSEPVWAIWHNAKEQLEFSATFDEMLIIMSVRGWPWECVLAEIILFMYRKNHDIFPHPVVTAYVKESAVYIIDRKPTRFGQFLHAVRYEHNFTKWAQLFDCLSKEEFIANFNGVTVNITLKIPRKSGPSGPRGPKKSKDDGSRERRLTGAERRAKNAGLHLPGGLYKKED